MDPLSLSALIGGIAQFASSIAGAVARKREQRRQNQMNMQMANYQNSLNVEQWNKENEYNSPANQMQRLKDAGVNPRLWWSNGSNTSASSPTLSAPEQQYTAVGGQLAQGLSDTFGSAINAVNQINQIKMQEEQMKLIRAQIGYYGSMSHLNDVNANLRTTEGLMKQISLSYHDLSERQRVYGKQLVLNNQLANYLNQYGANTLTPNKHGLLSVDMNSPIWRETPMTTLMRRQIASNIALTDAKKLESMWSSKSKQAGLKWLSTRMYSERLKQSLTQGLTSLTYHKRSNEVMKGELMKSQKDLQNLQLDLMRELINRKQMENSNYLPALGDMSSYFRFMLPPLYY